MTSASAELQAYYAARAPYYDAVYLKPERRRDIEFISDYLATQFTGREVIEIACGTGYWTPHLARAAQRVVAIDGTTEPLAFARLRPGTEQVIYRQADAYALPDDLGRFDGAFAGLWFSHVPRAAWTSFLAGVHRRLRSGARVVLIDNNAVQLSDFPIAATDADGNTYQHRILRDDSVHRVLKNFPTEAELRGLVAPHAATVSYRALENFWLLEYELT